MDYERLKKEITEIAAVAGQAPEPYREKCFELLLNQLLRESPPAAGAKKKPDADVPPAVAAQAIDERQGNGLVFPATVKAFMRRTGVAQSEIEAIILVEGSEFHFVREPSHSNISKGQVEWALLIALKNAILNGNAGLSVDAEAVRSVVQDKGFYDNANFAKNFKNAKYAAWFKGTLEPQGDPVTLSVEGEKALASLIKSFKTNDQG